ncbi:NlpC/P60 family protein [Lachnospiraceae bacterium ZAX-1]
MKNKKTLVICLIATMFLSQFQMAFASKLTNAENEREKAKENLGSVNSQINELENQRTAIKKEIDSLDSELVEVIVNMSVLEEKLTTKEDELAGVQEDLVKAKEAEKAQYEAMKKRIQFMYERGDTAFITSILESQSITDLLNQVEYYNEVYDYDRSLLIDYQTTKLQVQQLEKQVEAEIAEMKEIHESYQQEKINYENTIAERKVQVQNFGARLSDALSLAAKYQDTISAQDAIIKAEKDRIEAEARARAAAEAQARATASSNGASGGSLGNISTGGGGNANPGYSTGVSGGAIVDYACTFVGNPYVWGGNDPNTGADCSGFIKYVYGHYGIGLPRTSYELRSSGQEVSYANARAGDIICYEGHVAIYMGGGQIVHARGTAFGIVTGNATYKSIITVRRVL